MMFQATSPDKKIFESYPTGMRYPIIDEISVVKDTPLAYEPISAMEEFIMYRRMGVKFRCLPSERAEAEERARKLISRVTNEKAITLLHKLMSANFNRDREEVDALGGKLLTLLEGT